MFKLQSPFKCSPLDTTHLLRDVCLLSEQFLNSSILMPFSASAVFVSPLPHWQNVSLWGHFSPKVRSDEYGGWGAGSSCFSSKTAEHSAQCGQVHWWITHHEMDKSVESSKQISLTLNAASHNNAIWYTDTAGFLEHSSSGGWGHGYTTRNLPSRK